MCKISPFPLLQVQDQPLRRMAFPFWALLIVTIWTIGRCTLGFQFLALFQQNCPQSFPRPVIFPTVRTFSYCLSVFFSIGLRWIYMKSVWRGWSSTLESQTLLKTERGKLSCVFFCSSVFHQFAHWTAWIYFLFPPSCGERTWAITKSMRRLAIQPIPGGIAS